MTRRTRPMRHARTPVSTGPSRRLTRRGVTVGAVIGLTLSALPAYAYWTSSAATSASATVTTLQPPVTVTAAATGMTSVEIRATAAPAPGSGPAPTGYLVSRNGTPVCSRIALNIPCTQSGLTPGTTYTYTVASQLQQNWVSSAVSTQVTTDPVPAPSKPLLTSGSRSGALGDTYTADTTPAYSGTALVGSTVTLFVDGTAVGTSSTVTSGGTWSVSAGSPAANLQHAVTARANYQGGTSASSATQLLVIDTQRPTNGTTTSTCAVALVNSFCPGQVTVSVAGATDPQNVDNTPGSGPSYLDYTVNGGNTQSTAAGALSFTMTAPDGIGYPFTTRVRDAAGNGPFNSSSGTTSVTVDRTAPTATTINLSNGGQQNRVDSGDSVALTFTDVTSGMNPKSFCSAWGISGNQSLTGATVTLANSTGNANSPDVLTVSVSSSCGGAFAFGSVALNANYVGGNTVFSGSSISWTAATRTLTVTLGTTLGTVNTGVGSAAPTYTPSTSITDLAGNAMTATPLTPVNSDRF